MPEMYHVAPREARESIRQQGLLPGESGVWLWYDHNDAERFAGGDDDVWVVDPDGLEVSPETMIYGGGNVQVAGNTPDPISPDRLHLLTDPLADYIAAALLPDVRFSFEQYCASVHESAWPDVAGKAKRLIQEGRVTILRNTPTHVMAHVIGDGTDNNGTPDEHDVEITRHDPSSQVIEQWNCTCKWAEFSWGRTRNFKKYEGRPCSHVLATYWKAKSTPLDTTGEEEGYQVPRGQRRSPAGPGQESIPGLEPHEHEPGEQHQFAPDEEGIPIPEEPQSMPPPTPAALPSDTDITLPKAPQSPFSTPKQQPPQHEQMQLFDITAPPGQQAGPVAPIVSVPGGSPPTPGNPVKFPGTFSHFLPVLALHTSRFIYAADSLTEYFETQRAAGKSIHVALMNMVALERSGGKIPIPGAKPYGVSVEGIPLYNVMDLGWNPQTQSRENADVNILQGAPEQTGTYSDVPPGKYAEVLDFDPNLKMAYIVVPLDYPDGVDSRLHPHMLKGWVSYSDLRPIAPKRDPFRRKK